MGIYYMRFPTSEAGSTVSEREGKCGPREGREARSPRGKRSTASGDRGIPVKAQQKPSRSPRAQCSERERMRSKKKGLLLALELKKQQKVFPPYEVKKNTVRCDFSYFG
jgi:hypothetical protein